MLLLLACSSPDVSPAAVMVGTAGPIGHAASVSMAAMVGEGSACAEVRVPCVSDPCVGEVDVLVNEACPLPIAPHAEGRIPVTGTWTDGDTAVLAASFADVDADGHGLRIADISAFTVTREEADLSVAYAMEDVKVRGGGDDEDADVAVDQTGFHLGLALAGTPGDPADDTYTLTGGGQYVRDSSHVWQVALIEVRLEPACRENPVAGTVTMEEVGEESGGATELAFHDACDGTVGVLVSVGTSVGSSGSDVAFDMVE